MNEDELADFLDRGGRDADRGDTPDEVAAGRLRDLLADGSVWAEPTTGGADDLLAAIGAEHADRPSHSGPDVRPTPAAGGQRARRRTLVALAAAAALVVVVGVVGLVARSADDAGREVDVAELVLRTDTPGYTAEIRAGDSPTAFDRTIGESRTIETATTFTLDGDQARYYLVWITELDRLAHINEVEART